MQKIIKNSTGSRAVVINVQENGDNTLSVWANLYVNFRNGIYDADITLTRWEGKTLKGAEKWANKILENN